MIMLDFGMCVCVFNKHYLYICSLCSGWFHWQCDKGKYSWVAASWEEWEGGKVWNLFFIFPFPVPFVAPQSTNILSYITHLWNCWLHKQHHLQDFFYYMKRNWQSVGVHFGGWSVGQSVSQLVCELVGESVHQSVHQSVYQSDSQSVS